MGGVYECLVGMAYYFGTIVDKNNFDFYSEEKEVFVEAWNNKVWMSCLMMMNIP
jgi:hypothetical protein